MKDKILNVICDVFEIEKYNLSENPTPKEIETWDSLKHIQLIERLETQFSIEFKAEEFGRLMDLHSIEQIITSKLFNKGH